MQSRPRQHNRVEALSHPVSIVYGFGFWEDRLGSQWADGKKTAIILHDQWISCTCETVNKSMFHEENEKATLKLILAVLWLVSWLVLTLVIIFPWNFRISQRFPFRRKKAIILESTIRPPIYTGNETRFQRLRTSCPTKTGNATRPKIQALFSQHGVSVNFIFHLKITPFTYIPSDHKNLGLIFPSLYDRIKDFRRFPALNYRIGFTYIYYGFVPVQQR